MENIARTILVSMIDSSSENPQLVAVITIDEPKGQNAYGGVWAGPSL